MPFAFGRCQKVTRAAVLKVQEWAVSTPGHLKWRWCYSSLHSRGWCQRGWRRFWKGRQAPLTAESRVLQLLRVLLHQDTQPDSPLGLYPSQSHTPFLLPLLMPHHLHSGVPSDQAVVSVPDLLYLHICRYIRCLNPHHFNQGILQLLDISTAARAMAPLFFLAGSCSVDLAFNLVNQHFNRGSAWDE